MKEEDDANILLSVVCVTDAEVRAGRRMICKSRSKKARWNVYFLCFDWDRVTADTIVYVQQAETRADMAAHPDPQKQSGWKLIKKCNTVKFVTCDLITIEQNVAAQHEKKG